MQAKRPLVIVGKGAAYAHAELPIRNLLDRMNLPYLPTPMGMFIYHSSHFFIINIYFYHSR